MPRYKTLYHILFNAITDALRAMEQNNPDRAMDLLKQAQQRCEERYLSD